jgi:hypothetical protein
LRRRLLLLFYYYFIILNQAEVSVLELDAGANGTCRVWHAVVPSRFGGSPEGEYTDEQYPKLKYKINMYLCLSCASAVRRMSITLRIAVNLPP